VTLTGLPIPRDPARVRLECRVGAAPRPGDLTGDGSVDLADLDQIRLAPVDLDGDGLANAADVDALERHVRRATPLAAAATPFGSGCVGRSRSFYERFATSAFDLASSRMRLAYDPAGFYVVSANGAYVAPTAAATVLPLADDGTALVTLASPLSHPGGVTSTLEVCANGFVSAAAGNEPGYTPTVAAWLASPRARWGCWHDFNPQAVGGGRVKFEQIGSVSYVTWDGVVSYGTNSPATFQLQFDRATGNVTYAWGAVALAGNEWLVGFAAPAPNADLGARNLSAAAAATFATDAAELAPLALAGSRPELGSTASLTTSSLPPSTAIVVQALGVSRVQPALELTSFGMPGCFLHADLTALFVAPVVAGVAVHLLVVPNDASLVGYPVYAQSAALAAGVNDAGIVTSNGVELRVGL
jgi:hypothetical protein